MRDVYSVNKDLDFGTLAPNILDGADQRCFSWSGDYLDEPSKRAGTGVFLAGSRRGLLALAGGRRQTRLLDELRPQGKRQKETLKTQPLWQRDMRLNSSFRFISLFQVALKHKPAGRVSSSWPSRACSGGRA